MDSCQPSSHGCRGDIRCARRDHPAWTYQHEPVADKPIDWSRPDGDIQSHSLVRLAFDPASQCPRMYLCGVWRSLHSRGLGMALPRRKGRAHTLGRQQRCSCVGSYSDHSTYNAKLMDSVRLQITRSVLRQLKVTAARSETALIRLVVGLVVSFPEGLRKLMFPVILMLVASPASASLGPMCWVRSSIWWKPFAAH